MTMNVKSTSDTLAHPKLGTVGDFVVVLKVGNVVKGSTGLGAKLVDDVVVVASVVSSTNIGVGAEVTGGQQYDSSSSLINPQTPDFVSFSLLQKNSLRLKLRHIVSLYCHLEDIH